MTGFRGFPFGGRAGFFGGEAVKTTVVASRSLTPSTHGITLRKPEKFSFRPVQFTFLTLRTEQGPDSRPMSLATSPTRPNLEYGVRLSDSPYKRAFASLRPGDAVEIRGPFGDFVLDEERPALMIAGGIGITPLKGMVEFATDRRLQIPVRLVYSNRREDEIAYASELDELERRNPRFRVIHTLTGEPSAKRWSGGRGRISPALLRKATDGLDRPAYYLCGKPAMVSDVYKMLLELGTPEQDVKFEIFRGYWG